ncbi:hypothetical protein GYMLUDRAFT_1005770 [Collybiopsis luxurians FD-317 M1]|uniref:Uncharacterized protein n=1 Tax=Collybiopsis luxurians FD-317 M1 TaxID=944289 RepID=A0A0D0CJJ1_9AGAR|nr:hypothetical protein GYMLUDRAFT_1005770 [Collybiopsis luxurians FD-317 M1]
MGALISHLEQADDIFLLALSPEGLQRKMNLFYQWYSNNFFIINAIKSAVLFHGPAPTCMPAFWFGSDPVAIVKSYKYVSTYLKTGDYRVFTSLMELHYEEKASKGRTTAHAVLHIESMIGSLPVHEGKILYMGCTDPHLIWCEVAIDTSPTGILPLHNIQLSFFCCLLGLPKTTITAAASLEQAICCSPFEGLCLPYDSSATV